MSFKITKKEKVKPIGIIYRSDNEINIKMSCVGAGLTNQLFLCIVGILNNPNATKIKIGPFLGGYNNNNFIPVHQVIDIDKLSRTVNKQIISGPVPETTPLAGLGHCNTLKFNYFLKEITFRENFYNIANEFIKEKLTGIEKINTIHFRLENDAIDHWSAYNKLSKANFAEQLEMLYYNTIKENIPLGETIIGLTFDPKHSLLLKLEKEYNILTIPKTFGDNRELSAIIDLLIAEKCNEKFIGCYNFKERRGSTFSYLLWTRMKNAKKGYFIDLDNIGTPIDTQEHVKEPAIKNYIYMHICTIGDWENVIRKIFNIIKLSGLLEKVEEIRVSVLGDSTKILEILESPKVKIVFHSENTQLYERPILEILHNDALNATEPFNVLYLHSKGVSRVENKNITDWIDFMLFFLVEKHFDCLESLKIYDACGVNLSKITNNNSQLTFKNNYHFSGNFWWSKSDYIKTLPSKIGDKYLDPEFWIGFGTNLYSFKNSKINHYNEPFPRELYC
jgi:hypothetical protein